MLDFILTVTIGVDLAFESLLSEIFGSEFIESFKTKRPAGWVDLMIAFESRKRAANPYKDNPLNISLPFSFIDYYKKTKVPIAVIPYIILINWFSFNSESSVVSNI